MLDISQVKLAEDLGVSFQQIQKYERGVNRVGAGRLLEIAEVLGVAITFFFEDMPGKTADGGNLPSREAETDQMAEFLSSADGIRFVRAFLSINDSRIRRRITDLVKTLAAEDVADDLGEADNAVPISLVARK